MMDSIDHLATSFLVKRDNPSFASLIEALEEGAKRQVLVLCNGNHDDAQDVLQEAYMRIYRSIGSWKGQARFSTWVYRLIRNTSIDYLRSQHAERQRRKIFVSMGGQNSTQHRVNQASHRLEAEADRSLLVQALYSLPAPVAELIFLAELEELPLQEVAQRLSLPLGTVKSRLNRARSALAQKLNKEDFHAYS